MTAIEESMDRVRRADQEAIDSQVAFALGSDVFLEYWNRKASEADERLKAMHDRAGQNTATGDGQEGS